MMIQEGVKLRVFYFVAGCAFFLVMLIALIEDERTKLELPAEITFTGSVRRGERFEKELPNGLIFYLDPMDTYYHGNSLGWGIGIGSAEEGVVTYPGINRAKNYASVMTTPFRGVNTLQIEGWHFRNASNTGPNDDGSVHAPQYQRWLFFVENSVDYEIALDSLRCFMHSECEQFDGVKSFDNIRHSLVTSEASDTHGRIPTRLGYLTITKLELGNLEPEYKAWIEYMEFEVILNFELVCTGVFKECVVVDSND